MGLFNVLKAAFMYKKEVKKIEETYPNFFDFLKDYGYVRLADSGIAIEEKYLTSRCITSDYNVRYKCDKVIRFTLVYRKNADLVAVCKQFKAVTGLDLFMPSEMEQFQYITIYGWRYYGDKNKRYYASLVFGFGEKWCLPSFRNYTIHINSSFSIGGMEESIERGMSKDYFINYYISFIKKVVEDLIDDIKWYHELKNHEGGWYVKNILLKYKDKIPALYWGDEEVTIPDWMKKTKSKKNISTKAVIENSWSLVNFAKEYGPKVQIANCTNRKTGNTFKCVVFGEEDNRTFVAFSSKLGELTAKEMIERKHQLKVKKWIKGNEEGFTLYQD